MIGKRENGCAPVPPGRRPATIRRDGTEVQCEALFASPLQMSDVVGAEVAAGEISDTIQRLGPDGCACRMAQEFGDHPEEARDRMQWARHVVGELPAGPPTPAAGPAQHTA